MVAERKILHSPI